MRKTLETLNFDDPTVDETEEQQRSAEDLEIMQVYAHEIEKSSRRANLEHPERYDRLLEAARSAGINVDNIRADTGKKRYHIIHVLGYPSLNAKDGEKVTTMSAKPTRIGELYRDYIKTAKAVQLS